MDLDTGVAERQVRIAEAEGELFAGVIKAILEDLELSTESVRAGGTAAHGGADRVLTVRPQQYFPPKFRNQMTGARARSWQRSAPFVERRST
jgi:hypothetical protein